MRNPTKQNVLGVLSYAKRFFLEENVFGHIIADRNDMNTNSYYFSSSMTLHSNPFHGSLSIAIALQSLSRPRICLVHGRHLISFLGVQTTLYDPSVKNFIVIPYVIKFSFTFKCDGSSIDTPKKMRLLEH